MPSQLMHVAKAYVRVLESGKDSDELLDKLETEICIYAAETGSDRESSYCPERALEGIMSEAFELIKKEDQTMSEGTWERFTEAAMEQYLLDTDALCDTDLIHERYSKADILDWLREQISEELITEIEKKVKERRDVEDPSCN